MHMEFTVKMREECHCCHFMGYSIQLAGRDVSNREHILQSLLCTSCGLVDTMRNSSMDLPGEINLITHHTTELHFVPLSLSVQALCQLS